MSKVERECHHKLSLESSHLSHHDQSRSSQLVINFTLFFFPPPQKKNTLDFIWFKLWNSITYDSSLEVAFQPPTWARKDSKINWSTRYRNKNRVETVSPSQSVLPLPTGPQTMTANELRHQQWKEESESNDHGKFASKLEARAFYKELGGRKLKNKTGKSFGTDRTGWDDEGPHE